MFKRFSTVCMCWVLLTLVGCMIFSLMAQRTDTFDPAWSDVLTGFSIMWSVIGLPVAVLWISVAVSRYIFAGSAKDAKTIQQNDPPTLTSEELEPSLNEIARKRRRQDDDQD